MKVVEGQLPAIESKHSRTQADRRTFLKTVGASAVSVVGANAAFAEAAPESRQAAAESHPAEKPKPISSGPSQAEGIVEFARPTDAQHTLTKSALLEYDVEDFDVHQGGSSD